ncbi:MAG: protein BatD [Bacteroidales bacterium]|nr:protein BatD [Bacteroidales bacterium]
MKKRILCILSLLFMIVFSLEAQSDVTFKTICKKQVSVGEQFQVSYELNGDGKDFRSPNFTNFEIIGGPFSSTSSSVQIINGSVSRTNTQTYSFHLRAIKEGNFTIPQASITVDKKRITSEPCEINVVASSNGNSSYSSNTSNNNSTQVGIGNKEVFLEAVPNKRKVYLGEQIVLTYRLFYTIPISQVSVSKAPSYSGFWTKDVTDNNGSLQQSSIIKDGQQYYVSTIQEVVLFPQKSGKLTVDPLDITCIAQIRQQRNRSRGYDPFEDFFGDVLGTSYTNVKKEIKSQPFEIEVLPLPAANKPDSFKGAVGQYTFTSKIDKSELNVNDAFTLTLTVSGKGNIELLELPKPVFPPDFEVYDPKITSSVKDNALGISGSKKAEYIVIPRVSGDFTLEEIDFSYFNPTLDKYETLRSEEYQIKVNKTEGNSGRAEIYTPGQADIKYLGSDIQHINTSNNKLSITGMYFFLSTTYIIIICLMVVIFVTAFIIYKRVKKFNKNQVLVRNKQATKVAKKRLTNAHNFLKGNNQNKFYEEFSQALWGYISDKLNIVRSQLSMETVKEMMLSKDVNEEIVNEFIDLLHNCEFARFAPGDPSKKMDELYQKGIEIITKAEKILK